ncbi:MAG: TonB-dependent receptor [Nitrospiraceae bacterium]|nr:TonB-dependent receptor [Nitrospiraceae bacterium]
MPSPGYTEESSTKPAQAPIPELELIKEEETVSVASRYEQPISKAPSNVYVITDEDIRQSGATDLPTVFRRIPGMEVMQMTGADFNVSVRGNNQPLANKLLVIIDGRSIYVDAQASVFWKMLPVTLPEIKRIEVLKGPASAIYGFNAFDGIINIITKSPEEMRGTTLQFGAGELGTISSAAIHAGTMGNFGYRLSVGRDQNQQWSDRDALAFRSHKLNLQTEYALSAQSKLSISGGFVDVNRFDGNLTDIGSPSSKPSQGYAHVVYEHNNLLLRSSWTGFSDPIDVTLNPLIANLVRNTDRAGSSMASNFANTYNVEGQHTVHIGPANRFTYGMNYRHNTFSSNYISQFGQENRLGIHLQDEWKATETITIVAGGRYDLDSFIHATISPRLAVLYNPILDHTFRAALSVAYRPPTLFETHLQTQTVVTLPSPILSPPTTQSIGSANLAPEEIVSYEVGYQGWFFKHRLRVRTDLFFNHISNLISTRGTSSGISSFVNDPGQADIYGGEAGVEFLATRWLTGFANYSYQEIWQSFSDSMRRGAPRFKWNVGLRGDWESGLSGEVSLYHVGAATYPLGQALTTFAPFFPPGVTSPSERVDSYNLLNLRTGYKFWQQRAEAGYMRDAEVAVSAFNALNDKHQEYPVGNTIGSRVMGWLTVRY